MISESETVSRDSRSVPRWSLKRSSSFNKKSQPSKASDRICRSEHTRSIVHEFDDTASETEEFWNKASQKKPMDPPPSSTSSSSTKQRNTSKKRDDASVLEKPINEILAMGQQAGAEGLPFDKLMGKAEPSLGVSQDDVVSTVVSKVPAVPESKKEDYPKVTATSKVPAASESKKEEQDYPKPSTAQRSIGPVSIDGSTLGSFTTEGDDTLKTTEDQGGITGWLTSIVDYWSTPKDANYYYKQGMRDALKIQRKLDKTTAVDVRDKGVVGATSLSAAVSGTAVPTSNPSTPAQTAPPSHPPPPTMTTSTTKPSEKDAHSESSLESSVALQQSLKNQREHKIDTSGRFVFDQYKREKYGSTKTQNRDDGADSTRAHSPREEQEQEQEQQRHRSQNHVTIQASVDAAVRGTTRKDVVSQEGDVDGDSDINDDDDDDDEEDCDSTAAKIKKKPMSRLEYKLLMGRLKGKV